MRILITNDDGIDAEGLAILEAAARTLTEDVWVVAPATEQSGQSRAITLTNPLRIARLGDQRFAVNGTPADCVAMALSVVMKDAQPDLVLSGINQGFNIADDCLYSGTIGAAMQASSAGVRAIALSQAYGFLGEDGTRDIWAASRAHCGDTLIRLAGIDMPRGQILNVNFPNRAAHEVDGLAVVRQGARASHENFADEREDGRGHPYYWMRFRRDAGDAPEDTDLGALARGRISVTPLGPDLTAMDRMASLAEVLG